MVLKLLILLVCSIIFPLLYSFQASLFVKMLLLCVFLFTGINLIREMGNRKRSQEKDRGDNNNDLSVYFANETIGMEIVLQHEISSFISEIAVYQARASGKLLTRKEVKSATMEKLISPKDYEAAFLQVMKELQSEELKCVSCGNSETLVDKVRKLRKEYKNKYKDQTP